MNKSKIELSVVVNHPLKEYGHQGDTFVEGRVGTEYVLKVKNNYSHRVLVVPSIDGLNPLNGKESMDNEEGYVVDAYSSITIDGWRTSLSEVSKFVFDKKTQSYSAKIGSGTANCGIIGIKVFGEKLPEPVIPNVQHHHHYDYYWPYWPYYRLPTTIWQTNVGDPNYTNPVFTSGLATTGDNTNFTFFNSTSCSGSFSNEIDPMERPRSLNSCYFSASESLDASPHQLGTGWGETKESVVTQTTFTKGVLLDVLEIYYADRKGLEALGIDLSKSNKVAFMKPQAFSGFCKIPKN